MPSSPHTLLPAPNACNPDLHSSPFPLPLPCFALDATGVPSPSRSDSEHLVDSDPTGSANTSALADVDPQIVEALKSKDRIYVLKLGEQMENLINDRRPRIDLVPNTSYQRLLVHRCCTYYRLAPETDSTTKVITVLLTLESRIPTRRIAELVPAQSPTQPTFKIMRRSPADRQRQKPHSQAGSVAGEDAELSDPEPSEAGSLGGRSNATGSSKKHKTIAEREAAYNEARSRIFMDFDEKERGKEKDLSASSSTVSLTSGSVTSAGEISSVGDLDDSVSSPTTESEWSGPVVRDKDGRRSNGSSSRSLRSTGPSFNGSNSSRGSRAPSPSSFKYPTLYEPSPAAAPYDFSQAPVQLPAFGNPYIYSYPPPSTVSAPNYAPPFHYYPAYPYPHPQTSLQTDPGSPSNQPDIYSSQQPPPPQGVYVPYTWHSPPPPHPPAQHQPLPAPSPPIAPPASQYSTYTPPAPPYGHYPMAYYPSPPMHAMPPSSSPAQNQTHYSPEYNGTHDPYGTGRPYPGIAGQQSPATGPKLRGAPPARSAWSYGPGIGMGGFGVNGNVGRSGGGGEVVGPRLGSAMRRHTGNMNGNVGARTPASDEASSPASSSTSSSSRRTYTSASSQHPLPARPDWAVGLKPQPTLHSTHRHHEHSASSRNMSPARSNGQRTQQVPPPLQSTDFPPLTINVATEKRMPVAGVWNNTSSTRSILMPGNNMSGNALVNHSSPIVGVTIPSSTSKVDESEVTPEQLFGKGGNENPGLRGTWRSGGVVPNRNHNLQDRVDKDKERRGEVVANAILVDKIALLSVEDTGEGNAVNATNGVVPVALAT